MAQQEVRCAHFPFLEFLVGIERGGKLISMVLDFGILARFGASSLVSYALELVTHFGTGIFGSVQQRAVQFFQRRLDQRQCLLQKLTGAVKAF